MLGELGAGQAVRCSLGFSVLFTSPPSGFLITNAACSNYLVTAIPTEKKKTLNFPLLISPVGESLT